MFDRRADLSTAIPEDCELSFFTTVYLVLLTATTLGLGDIFPADDVARCDQRAGWPRPLLACWVLTADVRAVQ